MIDVAGRWLLEASLVVTCGVSTDVAVDDTVSILAVEDACEGAPLVAANWAVVFDVSVASAVVLKEFVTGKYVD